jgi:hypothetical protein
VYQQVAAQSSLMIVYVAQAHAHVQRMVRVVKTATVLEDYPTEEQRVVVRFCEQTDLRRRIFIKKRILFTVRSVCRVKRFAVGLRDSFQSFRTSQIMPDQVALLRLRQKQLCSWWKSWFELT